MIGNAVTLKMIPSAIDVGRVMRWTIIEMAVGAEWIIVAFGFGNRAVIRNSTVVEHRLSRDNREGNDDGGAIAGSGVEVGVVGSRCNMV